MDKEASRWRLHAACFGADPDGTIFFPPERGNSLQALAICETCPVQAPCLAYALADPSIKGVWGNTTERERRFIRAGKPLGKRKNAAVCGTRGGYHRHLRSNQEPCADCREAWREYKWLENATRRVSR